MKGYTRLFLVLLLMAVLPLGAVAQGTALEGRRLVKGVVQDTKGATIPGATIIIKGTDKGGVTDLDGLFLFTSHPRRRCWWYRT